MKMEIEKARTDVEEEMKKLGIDTKDLDFKCQIKPTKLNEFHYDDADDDGDDTDVSLDEDEMEEFDYLDLNECSDNDLSPYITGELDMRDYSHTGSLAEDDIFTVVSDSTGTEKTVRKSGTVYLLLRDRCKLSSDRLRRVMEPDLNVKKGMVSETICFLQHSTRNYYFNRTGQLFQLQSRKFNENGRNLHW